MSENLARTPYGFGGVLPPGTWHQHTLDPSVAEGRNTREYTIFNGGVNNERKEGDLYFTIREINTGPETCLIACGEVFSLGPGGSATGRIDFNLEFWLQWDKPDMAIQVLELYPK